MKIAILLFVVSTCILSACTPCNHCASNKNYIRAVDTLKPYDIKGKYCIERARDTILLGRKSLVQLSIFDRKNGKVVPEAVAWFHNDKDTLKFILGNYLDYLELPAGSYIIDISTFNHGVVGFSTKKKILVGEATFFKIRIYLGSIMQW